MVPLICSERDLQRQLTLTKEQLRDLRTSNDNNQAKLMDQSERQGEDLQCIVKNYTCVLMFVRLDHEVVARLAEVDMIVADLERANGRVAAVERRNVCVCWYSLIH